MTRRLLIDGDSIAKSPTSGRLSIGRLDSAVGFLRRELTGAELRVTLVVSNRFAEAMTAAQRARLDRIVSGTFQVLPDGVHLRDFIVRGADDGSAIVVSNNAFTRQRESFAWLAEPGSGRHVLSRRQDEQGPWEFVEARPIAGDRRTLGEIVGASPTAPRATPPEAPAPEPIESEPPPAHEPVPSEVLATPTNAPSEVADSEAEVPNVEVRPQLDEASIASVAADSRASTEGEVTPRTPSDLCALFGVDGEYVLALINRGQGAAVERLDHVLEERTRARVVRLLTDDINRYHRRIDDLPKLRKVSLDDVKRRARNTHVPMALRPGGDRTSVDGFSKLLEKFSAASNQLPATQSVSELAKRFGVDVQYVIDIASAHSEDRVTASSTLTKGLAGLVRQSLEFDLFPFTRRLSTAAEHLGIDIEQAKGMADQLSITTAARPGGWRLSAGDYHRLMTDAWPLRSGGPTWAPPSPTPAAAQKVDQPEAKAKQQTTQPKQESATASADPGTKASFWNRLRPKRSKP